MDFQTNGGTRDTLVAGLTGTPSMDRSDPIPVGVGAEQYLMVRREVTRKGPIDCSISPSFVW